MKLICLPHAGGSEVSYSDWNEELDKTIEIFTIELNGRGRRIDNCFYKDMYEMTNDVYNQMKAFLEVESEDYMIFGHSMGGLVAYELYYKILNNNNRLPKKLIISGINPPHIKEENKDFLMSDNDLKNKLILMGGIPKEISSDEEIFNFFLPIIRNDIKNVAEYKFEGHSNKISIPVDILYGIYDSNTFNQVMKWNDLAEDICIYKFKGDHFFINSHKKEIIELINKCV